MTRQTRAQSPEKGEGSESPADQSSSYPDNSSDDGQNVNNDLAQQPSHASTVWVASTLSLPREASVVAIVCMAQFCTQSAYMEILALIHVIGHTFNVTDAARLAWLVAAYSLTVGTFIVFSGRLGDAFGYKRILVLGFAWFSLWSFISGFSVYADSFVLAVVARALQGLGPALCLPNALAILGAIYPPGHRKAMAFSIFGAVAPMGGTLGAAVAAAISLVWWPWALWALGIWLAMLAVAGYVVVPNLPPKDELPSSWKELLVHELDLPGAVIGILALVLFNFAWNQAPIDGWATAVVLVPLICGLFLFIGFLVFEFRVASKPLLPFEAVNADVAFVLAAVVCGWATFGIWTLYLAQILEDTRGMSPLLTMAWLCPVVIFGALAAIITGNLLGKWGVRPPLVMAMALSAFTAGIIITATAPPHQIYWAQIFVSTVIMPFGMDMSFPAATLILSNAVKREHQGIGASLVNTVVNYGIALGVGFAGTVEVHVNKGGLDKDDRFLGYRGAMYMGIGMSGLGLGVCAVFLWREYRHCKSAALQGGKA